MSMKTALTACVIAVLSSAATAQISFTTIGHVNFTQTFDPGGGLFAPGAYTSGDTGYLSADTDGRFSMTYLGQESSFDDGARMVVNGKSLHESDAIGTSIVGDMTAGKKLDFTFFSSGGEDVTNGVVVSGHSSFALLGRNVATSAGTFAYLLGYNDSVNHNDWDDFVVGINPMAPVPEPSSYALLLAGLGVIGFAARRRLGR